MGNGRVIYKIFGWNRQREIFFKKDVWECERPKRTLHTLSSAFLMGKKTASAESETHTERLVTWALNHTALSLQSRYFCPFFNPGWRDFLFILFFFTSQITRTHTREIRARILRWARRSPPLSCCSSKCFFSTHMPSFLEFIYVCNDLKKNKKMNSLARACVAGVWEGRGKKKPASY